MRQFFYYDLDYTDDNALTTSADLEHSLAVQKPASLVVINPSILFILSTIRQKRLGYISSRLFVFDVLGLLPLNLAFDCLTVSMT